MSFWKAEQLLALATLAARAPIGGLVIARFKDPIYVLTQSIGWKPNTPDQAARFKAVEAPKGFVTDFASVPSVFFSMLPRDGDYAHAAVVHDYLYWTQDTTREVADEIFRQHMADLNIGSASATAIYNAVRWFGGSAWTNNAALKAKERETHCQVAPRPARHLGGVEEKKEVFE